VDKKTVIKSFIELSSGTLLAQGLTLASLPILLDFYPPAQFGTFAWIVAISSLAVPVIVLRLDMALAGETSEKQAEKLMRFLDTSKLCWLCLGLSILGLECATWTRPHVIQTICAVTAMSITSAELAIRDADAQRRGHLALIARLRLGGVLIKLLVQFGFAVFFVPVWSGLLVGVAAESLFVSKGLSWGRSGSHRIFFSATDWRCVRAGYSGFLTKLLPSSWLTTLSNELLVIGAAVIGGKEVAGTVDVGRKMLMGVTRFLSEPVARIFHSHLNGRIEWAQGEKWIPKGFTLLIVTSSFLVACGWLGLCLIVPDNWTALPGLFLALSPVFIMRASVVPWQRVAMYEGHQGAVLVLALILVTTRLTSFALGVAFGVEIYILSVSIAGVMVYGDHLLRLVRVERGVAS
jgi:hypothetical protein